MNNKFKYLIIGSGPGGTTAAKTLIDHSIFDFAIIEEGKLDQDFNMGSFDDLTNRYRNGGGQPIFGNPLISYAEGMTVGGGSEVNSGLYHRAPDNVVKEWEKFYELKNLELEEIYSKLEEWLCVNNENVDLGLLSNKLIEGSKASDLKVQIVKRWTKFEDNKHIRQTMKKAFYEKKLDNLNILTNQKAVKINFKSDKAVSVTLKNLENNNLNEIYFDNLILACGTFQTPLLLKNSDYKFINKLTFQIHPHMKIGALFNNKILDEEIVSQVQLKDPNNKFSLGTSINTNAWKALFLSDNWQGNIERYLDNKKYFDQLGIFYSMIKPSNKGNIVYSRLLKNIFLKYKVAEKDKINMFNSTKKLIELLFSQDAQFVYLPNSKIKILSKYSDFSENDFYKYFDKFNLHTVHSFSSIRIGENNNSEANSFGKLKNAQNIYICDASIIPSAPGVNPQGTLMALVYRNILNLLSTK